MKKERKFLTATLTLVLASVLVLVGCMYAIGQDKGEPRPYVLDGMTEPPTVSPGFGDEPLSQEEMQAKFDAMSKVEGNTVTPVTAEFLEEFWASNHQKEVIHSLSTEEVLFLVQDSIRIYEEYEEVVLTGFEPDTVYQDGRFPELKQRRIQCDPWGDYSKTLADIQDIIEYRLRAVSSPKAFITGYEALIATGRDPAFHGETYPGKVFYFPGFSAETDREALLEWKASIIEPEVWMDHFWLNDQYDGSLRMILETRKDGLLDMDQVFPTEKMVVDRGYVLCTRSGLAEPWASLDTTTGECVYIDEHPLSGSLPAPTYLGGTFTLREERIVLEGEGWRYVFLKEGENYCYCREESQPDPESGLQDGKAFYLKRYRDFQVTGGHAVAGTYGLTEEDVERLGHTLEFGAEGWQSGTPDCDKIPWTLVAGDRQWRLCTCSHLIDDANGRVKELSVQEYGLLLDILDEK